MYIFLSGAFILAANFVCICLAFDESLITSEFRQCTTAEQLNASVRKHISSRSNKELDSLISSADSSISVCAAWQQVLNAETNESRNERLEKFIGVSNSKISDLPDWWTAVIRTATVDDFQVSYFGRPSSEFPNKNSRLSVFGKNHSKRHDGQLVIAAEAVGPSFTIPAARSLSPLSSLTYMTSGDECFFARYLDLCYSYKISCIKARELSTKWESKVWATGNLFGLGGPTWHRIELAKRDNKLIVFGASSECIYAEVFDAGSGKPICRFSSILFVELSIDE